MQKKILMVAAALAIILPLSSAAYASDGLGKTLNTYYGTENLSFGGLTYTGSGEGTIPQIRVGGSSRIGNFYLGNSARLAFGKIDGLKADRFSFNIMPGWIIPLNSDLDIIPYVRLAAVLQEQYSGTSLRNPGNQADLKFGYDLGGGAALQWSPVNRLVVMPSADVSYYRQGYAQYNNNNDTHSTVYLSTTEYREKLGVYYYLTNWLNIGVHVGADQFGTGANLVSYGAGLGINF